ncbi:MAG: dienelactone hydrolase family protein [Hyphomicrobiaceae bacterium]|nr:dienelactone hydrolase family protein [Hyphomicrobiaceae bacterium]
MTLKGPRLEPEAGPADSLVVLLHGYGASGDDLIALGEQWRPLMPRTAFVAPHAPERLPMGGMAGFQWFHLTMRDAGEYWRGVTKAAPALEAFLAAELMHYGLTGERLALVGFSQGTMMALHVGLRTRLAPAAILGYSGMIAGPEHLVAEMRNTPPVLLVHGDQDEVIPVEAMVMTREALLEAGLTPEWHVSPGVGHGIDEAALAHGGRFLRWALGGRR